jgi:hypothetical protein
MREFQRNVVSLIAAALLSCLAVGLFNFIMDPYGINRQSAGAAGSSPKPAIYRRVKLAKAYDLRRLKPQAVVLGTSRSHLGIRMTHPGWGVPVHARYNAAFDGATTKEMYAYLLHAKSISPLRQVVLGLDFWQLGRGPAWSRPDFDPGLLFQPDNALHNAGVYGSDLALLISTDTTKESVNLLRHDGPHQPQWLAPDGQRLGDIFFHQVEPDFSKSPGDYFRNIDRQEVGFMLTKAPMPTAAAKLRPEDGDGSLTSFDYIDKIVAFCRREGIDLRIFITPSHAHQLEIASELGGWPSFERGKRELVQLLSQDAARHGGAGFPLYDFAGYSSITTETVPADRSPDEMQYYWDSSHFKDRVGDWVLVRLFGSDKPDDPPPADFGVRLVPENLDAVLEETRARQADYRRTHVGDLVFIRSLIREARGDQNR